MRVAVYRIITRSVNYFHALTFHYTCYTLYSQSMYSYCYSRHRFRERFSHLFLGNSGSDHKLAELTC